MKFLSTLALTIILSASASASEKSKDDEICIELGNLVSSIYKSRFNGIPKNDLVTAVINSNTNDSLKVTTINYINVVYSMKTPATKKEQLDVMNYSKNVVYSACINN